MDIYLKIQAERMLSITILKSFNEAEKLADKIIAQPKKPLGII